MSKRTVILLAALLVVIIIAVVAMVVLNSQKGQTEQASLPDLPGVTIQPSKTPAAVVDTPTATAVPPTATTQLEPASAPPTLVAGEPIPIPLVPISGTMASLVDLEWGWDFELGSDEWFELQIWPVTETEPRVFAWQKETWRRITAAHLLPGKYWWQVVLVEGRGETRGDDVSGYSPAWIFEIARPYTLAKISITPPIVPTRTASPTPVPSPTPTTRGWIWIPSATPRLTIIAPSPTSTSGVYPGATATFTPGVPTATLTPGGYPGATATFTPGVPTATLTPGGYPGATATSSPIPTYTFTPGPTATFTTVPPAPTNTPGGGYIVPPTPTTGPPPTDYPLPTPE